MIIDINWKNIEVTSIEEIEVLDISQEYKDLLIKSLQITN